MARLSHLSAAQGLRLCRRTAATTLSARQLPVALAAYQDPVSCGTLSSKTVQASLSAERLTDQRISDAGEPSGLGPAFRAGCAGRRPRFSGLTRAVVKQKQQQQTARTPQPPAKPPVSARDVVIAVDDTNDAQQAVEWAAGNVLKGGGRLFFPAR